ncbi:MAG TPA: MmgE/PrpD family protein [Steroidobacteraceae bacterium]|nr:MmgE/PrpD family protein [Steroidobacteraceae bacterium]
MRDESETVLPADSTPGVSRSLARFVERTGWSDVPAAVQHEAVRALVNYFAAALAGCASPVIERAATVFASFRASEAAGLIGRRERTDVLNAAALNAMSANVHDFDDTHLPTVIHPSAPVAAALFALAESTPMSGEQLLLALVLGVECTCRIGLAVSPGHYRRGWHISSTCGVFGAAAAAGKALRLDEGQLVWAFGQASAQAAGVLETLGTMAKSLGFGQAARGGVLSALLAAQDFSGPPEPLAGNYGFLRVSSDHVDPAAAHDTLGREWALLSTGYKPYPCGIVLHAAIDACLQLRRDAAGAAWTSAAIERIELTGHPLLRERADRPRPASSSEAQVSAQHALAVALARGSAGLADFTAESIADPELQALRERVVLIDDPAFAIEAAHVAVRLRDGRSVACRVQTPRGAPARPLSDAELEAKLRALAVYGASGIAVQPLLDALWGLPRAPDAAAIMRAACAPAAAASALR